MRARLAVPLAALCVVTGANAAVAAAKPACLLVVDAAGDGTSFGGTVPNRDSLDIRSADIATGARNLVGVLRLGSVSPDPTLATGVNYTLSWRAGAVHQAFSLIQYADGSRVAVFTPNVDSTGGGSAVEATFAVQQATNTLTFSVPRKANPVLAKRGARFNGLSVTAAPDTNIGVHQNGFSFTFDGSIGNIDGDTASSGKTYTDLARSCVKGV